MTFNYPALDIDFKTGREYFKYRGKRIPQKLKDFWSWAFSDLVNNATRGILAEYIVGLALNAPDLEYPREVWAPYDLELNNGIKIEVKSGAYIQSWDQRKLSKISFTIRPTRGIDLRTLKHKKNSKRQADIYVFCVLNCKDQEKINPLNLDQWEFYVVPTKKLNRIFGVKQKQVSLAQIKQIAAPIGFEDLKRAVRRVIREIKKRRA